jgi:hypothetical protein
VQHRDETTAGPQQWILVAGGRAQHQHVILLEGFSVAAHAHGFIALAVIIETNTGARAVAFFDVNGCAEPGEILDEVWQEDAFLAGLLQHARKTDGER